MRPNDRDDSWIRSVFDLDVGLGRFYAASLKRHGREVVAQASIAKRNARRAIALGRYRSKR